MGEKGSPFFTHLYRLYVQCERKGANLVNNLAGLVTKDPNLQQLKNRPPPHPRRSCQMRNGM